MRARSRRGRQPHRLRSRLGVTGRTSPAERRPVARDADQATLRQYLLDEMSAEEQDRLEQRYLAEDEMYESLRAAEETLIQDYWQGQLSVPERERFEARYLASPVRRERAALVKNLMAYASRKPERTRSSGRASVWARSPAWVRAAVWALAALGVSMVTLHDWSPNPEPTGAGQGSATRSPAPVSPGQTASAVPVRTDTWQRLTPGLSRSTARTGATLTLGPGPLRLRLDLPKVGLQAYTVVLEAPDGREVWKANAIEAEPTQDAFAVFVEIPRAT